MHVAVITWPLLSLVSDNCFLFFSLHYDSDFYRYQFKQSAHINISFPPLQL